MVQAEAGCHDSTRSTGSVQEALQDTQPCLDAVGECGPEGLLLTARRELGVSSAVSSEGLRVQG